jgi:predicted phosphodiesterase
MADIHGNWQALEAVLADLEKYQPLDGILVAGDIISGPQQQRVLQRLVGLGAVMIQGNNEQVVTRIADGTAPDYLYTAKQFALRRWAHDHLTPQQLALVCSLPEQTVFHLPGAHPIRMAHGSPRDISELVIPQSCVPALRAVHTVIPRSIPGQMDEIFCLMREPVLILGHTHLAWSERRDGKFALNPGAVNFPENGWTGAQYALLHWDSSRWEAEFHAVGYDMGALRQAYEESGILSTGIIARIFLEEAAGGKGIGSNFMALANRLAEAAGVGHLPYFPDEVWERAEREFKLPGQG